MNNRGQTMQMMSIIMVAFMTIIVGVVLFQVIAQEVGRSTNTQDIENISLGSAAVDATEQYLDFRALSDVIVFNATNGVTIPADNYTITNNAINPITGSLAVNITPQEPAPELGFDIGIWTIDATAQPTTYIAESGGRAMAGLIIIFFALAIAVVALEPTLRSSILSEMGR